MPHARIILAGDSTALGFLNTGPAPYAVTVRVQIWTGDAWNFMNPGVNTGTPNHPAAWGSEVGIANEWLADNSEGFLWIVKNIETVKGGATLGDSFDPTTGPMFASATRTINAAMDNLDGTEFAFDHFDAAFISLGTNDALNPSMAANMLPNLIEFNAAARSAWHVTKLVEARIGDAAGAPAENLAVRQAQWQADQADADLVTFKTIGFETMPDLIHFASGGQLELGQGLYDGWMQ